MLVALYTPLSASSEQESILDWRWCLAWREALTALNCTIEDGSDFPTLYSESHKYQQDRIRSLAFNHADRLANKWIARLRDKRPQLWITIQPYHQAPDWVGMHVCQELKIPYLLVNPTIIPEEVAGFWRDGYQQTVEGVQRASKVIVQSFENQETLKMLIAAVDHDKKLQLLKPFINPEDYLAARKDHHASRQDVAQKFRMDPNKIWLLAVAPFQAGLVMDSFRLLAESLTMVKDPPWQLMVLGSGSKMDLAREAFAGLPAQTVFCYNVNADAAHHHYFGAADVFVWPALNPGQNYALLEALAAGLPTVTGRSRFNQELIAPNQTGLVVKENDPWAMAEGISRLIENPTLRQQFSNASIAKVQADHHQRHALPILQKLFQQLVPASAPSINR
ncbi:MAG: glycosyltransferase [Holosporaceae bacterium]|jgi:glycosyltransferase involved in cell wall biosynthesis|nr:glycosyltransferase [Rhodospirillaceae bacterium]